MSVLNVKRMRDDAFLPTYDEKQQYVLYSPLDLDIEPNKIYAIGLGIQTSFPCNYAALVVENGGLTIPGGLIDSDYRGEIYVVGASDKHLKITKGQPLANMVMIEIDHPVIESEDLLSSSEFEEECGANMEK